ncbi:hypothetical protein AA14362_1765 [Acetobacter cerevisiae DSM 14362]|nr:hypothetical protein AA14362_1765 [Acetobacter cerevisiae DSM 14362]
MLARTSAVSPCRKKADRAEGLCARGRRGVLKDASRNERRDRGSLTRLLLKSKVILA